MGGQADPGDPSPVVGGDEPDDVVLGDERVQDMQVAALRHAPAVLPDRRHDIAVHHREPWVGLCQHPRRGGAPATRRVVAGVTPAWAATLLAGSAAAVVKGSAPV